MAGRNPFRSSRRTGVRRPGRWGDRLFFALTGAGASAVILLLIALVYVLYDRSSLSIRRYGFSFLTTQTWDPVRNIYGIVPSVAGTLLTSALALAISVPLSLGAAIFLTQQAPIWLRRPVSQILEILAAVPSIIYGFWGLIVLVPLMRYQVEPVLAVTLGWTGWFGDNPIGLDVLTASVVLSIMTVPTITAISRETMSTVPRSQKEAALSLGATDWEVTRHAVLPFARSGILAGIVLGLGRALGETMAVLLVIGNRNIVPTSLFSQGQTIATLIANNYTEASGPLELSSLIEAGLFLLAITLVINIGARTVIARFQSARGAELT